jgi:hypothetical protein
MEKCYTLILAILLFAACQGNSGKQAAVTDSVDSSFCTAGMTEDSTD